MTEARERISRRSVDKFAQRRAQLAESALQALSELGYARTSLREIAQKSDFSHGVLHYYFADKVELLTYAVRQFEEVCVTRYDDVVAASHSAADLKRGFGAAMAGTLRADAVMHRLWYDLRNQSLFEESFRADVLDIDEQREAMVWRVVERYAEFAGVPAKVAPPVAYATFDGLFQRALLQHLAGQEGVAEDLEQSVSRLLELLVCPGSPAV
ncbi:TetR/AcrR family transcriptional regulator [Amycolatopsis sp. NBC_00345]|uniref:TetR/AcrR family transcriptional regulator n=1 Tax=Amycolatopsis sp. NBC_00345 TaxID=2975955 RepID=UPI002E25AC67